MKKLLSSLLVIFFFSATTFSQQNPLDSFMEKYSDNPGFYYFDLKTNMVSKAENQSNPENLKKEINLKLVSYEESSGGMKASSLYDSFFKQFNRDDYTGLVEVNGSGENVEIMVKKIDQKVSEFIIAIKESKETTLIAATGNFDLKDLAKISELKHCKGFDVLEKLCEE